MRATRLALRVTGGAALGPRPGSFPRALPMLHAAMCTCGLHAHVCAHVWCVCTCMCAPVRGAAALSVAAHKDTPSGPGAGCPGGGSEEAEAEMPRRLCPERRPQVGPLLAAALLTRSLEGARGLVAGTVQEGLGGAGPTLRLLASPSTGDRRGRPRLPVGGRLSCPRPLCPRPPSAAGPGCTPWQPCWGALAGRLERAKEAPGSGREDPGSGRKLGRPCPAHWVLFVLICNLR